jgi:hypothetical protein
MLKVQPVGGEWLVVQPVIGGKLMPVNSAALFGSPVISRIAHYGRGCGSNGYWLMGRQEEALMCLVGRFCRREFALGDSSLEQRVFRPSVAFP